MQALMQAGKGGDGRSLLNDVRPALGLLDDAEDDDSGPLATWSVSQVKCRAQCTTAAVFETPVFFVFFA